MSVNRIRDYTHIPFPYRTFVYESSKKYSNSVYSSSILSSFIGMFILLDLIDEADLNEGIER